MKILKVTFKNINSLQGEHSIDFTAAPFNHNTLFAITGPTGSGKSTILDVITLALFNNIPRLAKVSKPEIESKGAILTKGEKEAFARVTYESKKGTFTSEWSISTARTGALREYEMEVSDALTNKILTNRKSEVPAKNEILIGLKYDQFIKSVILAQGEFAKFLQVPKKERSDLLEKITGTDIYRRIGRRAFEKYRDFKSEIDVLEQKKKNWKELIVEKDVFSEWQKEKEKSEVELKTLDDAKTKLKNQIDQIKEINSEKDDITQLQKEEKENNNELKNFEENDGFKLAKHSKLAPYIDEIRNWKMKSRELKISLADQKSLNVSKDEWNRKKSHFDEKIEQLLSETVTNNQYDKELSNFERKYLEKEQQYNHLIEKGTSQGREINLLLKPLQLNFAHFNQKVFDKITLIKNEQDTYIKRNSIDLKEGVSLQESLENLKSESDQLLRAKSDAEKIIFTEKNIGESKIEKDKLVKEIEGIPEEINHLKTELKTSQNNQKIYELKRDNNLLKMSLEAYRNKLNSGEPCPLCGSKEHPYVSHDTPKDQDKLEEKINHYKKLSQELSNKLSKLLEREKNFKTQIKTIAKKIVREKEENEKAKGQFSNQYKFDVRTNWEDKIKSVKSKIQLTEKYITAKEQLAITNQVLPKIKEIVLLKKNATVVNKEKRELYDNPTPVSDFIENLKKEWQNIDKQLNILQEKIKTNDKNISNLTTEVDKISDKLLPTIKKLEFESLQTAFVAILPYDELNKLEKRKKDLTDRKSTIQTKKEIAEARLKSLKEKVKVEDVEILKKDLDTLIGNIDIQRQALEDITIEIKNQKEYKVKIKGLNKAIKEEEQKTKYWRLLKEMIGDANGKNFNDFAQGLTLVQLLHLANKRLEMLGSRYLFTYDNSSEQDSLVVIDKDMGNQERSVKTLSGGETFIVSLALALALSDLAARNVTINSLFIDEGFGTLDPETLDKTIDTLERLQNESSKTIGVISHVSSLKERISTQIQLIPNGRGFSTINIIN